MPGPKARDLAGIVNLTHTRLYSPRGNARVTNGRTLNLFGKSRVSARQTPMHTSVYGRLGDFAQPTYSISSSHNGSQTNTQIQITVSVMPNAIMATGHRAMIVVFFLRAIGSNDDRALSEDSSGPRKILYAIKLSIVQRSSS